MIPDTFSGGLILSLVNIVVVFLVLIIIAFTIGLIYRTVSASEKTNKKEALEIATWEPEPVPEPEGMVPVESLDAKRKAAIIAALYACTGGSVVPVFVRRIPDAGAWGRSSRALATK